MYIRRSFFVLALVAALSLVATACSSDDITSTATGSEQAALAGACATAPTVDAITATPGADFSGVDLTLATHDSFLVSEGTFEAFTAETGITVTQVGAGDAGQLVSSAVLTKDNPSADVLFGIDNTFLCRGLNADIFAPYRSAALSGVDSSLDLDSAGRVTPIDFGDVCVNYWKDAVPSEPKTLDDLTDPAFSGAFVTQDPETSSPGFAFLLATIAKYGDDWQTYWADLAANDVSIAGGWSDAYYGEFTAGGGDRSVVTSYASSPPADVIFADPPIDTPNTAVIVDSCFRQIEFAGILAGTEHPEAAAALIDFMLSPTFQEDIPGNMFVYPALSSAALPQEFVDFTADVPQPLTLNPMEIEANRDEWTATWREIVLR